MRWHAGSTAAVLVTADQILLHAMGDYVLQSDWMANEKTKQSFAAAVHALTYSAPFMLLSQSWAALVVVAVSHFVIDRWRLARFVVWAKNHLAPRSAWQPWSECSGTGYHKDRPAWMAVWLLIFADNALHVLCNALALKYL